MNISDGRLPREYLTELLRKATGDPARRLSHWRCEPLHGGFGGAIGGTALFRYRLYSADSPPFQLVLKILQRRAGEDGRAPYYWKREYEVYRSGLLAGIPRDAFVTPRIFHWQDHGETCWIFMQYLEDGKGEWTLADFHEMGRRLGRFNGAFLEAADLPNQPWLTLNWHAAIVPALADAFDALDAALKKPLARLTLPLEARDEILSIWQARERFREALFQLPQTFCHIDAFRRNLLHSGDGVALIDWAMAGRGAIGVDLVALVAVSLYYDKFSADFAENLDAAVFSGYIKGLRQVGWRGEAAQARLGYVCGMTLRGLAGVKQDINLLLDDSQHAALLRTHAPLNLEEIARFFAEIRRFRLLKMAREAKSLLGI